MNRNSYLSRFNKFFKMFHSSAILNNGLLDTINIAKTI